MYNQKPLEELESATFGCCLSYCCRQFLACRGDNDGVGCCANLILSFVCPCIPLYYTSKRLNERDNALGWSKDEKTSGTAGCVGCTVSYLTPYIGNCAVVGDAFVCMATLFNALRYEKLRGSTSTPPNYCAGPPCLFFNAIFYPCILYEIYDKTYKTRNRNQ